MTTQSNTRSFSFRSITSGLWGLCVLGLLVGFSTLPAAAQLTSSPEATTAEPVTVSELAHMLTSPVTEERDNAFHRVLILAHYSPEVDLTPVVPVFVEMYENDSDEKYRLAAISALHAIGDEEGLKQVRKRFVQEPSLVVQYVSVCTLLEHYGPEAFAGDAAARALAMNVLDRRQEVSRLVQMKKEAGPAVAGQ